MNKLIIYRHENYSLAFKFLIDTEDQQPYL